LESDQKYRFDYWFQNYDLKDLLFFVNETRTGQQPQLGFFEPTDTVFLDPGRVKEKHERLFYPDETVTGLEFGFCSERLTAVLFDQMIDFKVKKLISPVVLVKPVSGGRNSTGNLNVKLASQKVSPTKYYLAIKNVDQPLVLILSDQFSLDWKLYAQSSRSPFKGIFETWGQTPIFENNQFLVEGYANGWLIDQTGDFQLILEYRPQKIFYQGVMVSGAAVLIGLTILLIKRRF
jgi:hypothetical protein